MDAKRDKKKIEAMAIEVTQLKCSDCQYCQWTNLWTYACIKFGLPIKADGPACISIVKINNPPGNSGMSN